LLLGTQVEAEEVAEKVLLITQVQEPLVEREVPTAEVLVVRVETATQGSQVTLLHLLVQQLLQALVVEEEEEVLLTKDVALVLVVLVALGQLV
jgi:kynureninase